jgi:integrase/recombinase XerD
MSKKLPKAILSDEFPKLVKNTKPKDTQAKIAFLLAYGAGLRLSEVLSIKPENIKKTYLEVISGKGSKDRNVPKPKGWKDYMTKLLPIKKSGRSLERNFKAACKRAGLNPDYTFHSLRHGFATRLMENGVPLSHIQVLLGHSNISTTNVYTRARPVAALKSYEELF